MKYFVVAFCLLFVFEAAAESAGAEKPTTLSEDRVAEARDNDSNTGAKKESIPFKEQKSLAQQGTPVITVMLVFALLVVAFMYFFKNKLSLVNVPGVNLSGEKNIQVLEVKRLNARLTAFHISVKNKEIFVLQSGDSIKTININNKSDGLVE